MNLHNRDWSETREERQQRNQEQAGDNLLLGGGRRPDPPRDLVAQSGPRGVLLTWGLPVIFYDIIGWRIYKDTESNLIRQINDRGTRQAFVESTAGAAPPMTNFFVASLGANGRVSQLVQAQSAALTEAGAPSLPAPPPSSGSTTYRGGNKLPGEP